MMIAGGQIHMCREKNGQMLLLQASCSSPVRTSYSNV